MTESMVTVGDAELCVDTYGREGDPAVLLIHGATASMDWWEPEFCERIAAAGRFVIRYDHRDTGRSTGSPVGEPSYTGADLSADPVRILDALGLRTAHLVGVSMGGAISQEIAVEHPDRVLSLTLIATSPVFDRADAAPLPPPAPHIAATFVQDADPADEPDWSDQDAVVDAMVEEHRLYTGSLGLDDQVREIARRVVERTPDMQASVTNHWLVGEDDDGPHHTMAQIDVPTLVMHGSDDPLFPPAHGQALAAEIRGATLVLLEGMGHEAPQRPLWDVVIPAIVEHTSAASAAG